MAHIDDKITKVAGKAFAALEAPGKSPGDTSIRLSRAFPEGSTVIFFMMEVNPSTGEVVPDTETVWRGIPVGNTLTQLKLVRGADRRYEPGQATQVYIPINAHWANDLIDALLVHHDTNGNLKPSTVTYDHIDEKTEYKYIASPNDLNDAQFLVPGKWRFGGSQQLSTAKNWPTANDAGVLETISYSGGATRPGTHAWSYILQIFTTLNGKLFIRNINSTDAASNIIYGAWQEFAKREIKTHNKDSRGWIKRELPDGIIEYSITGSILDKGTGANDAATDMYIDLPVSVPSFNPEKMSTAATIRGTNAWVIASISIYNGDPRYTIGRRNAHSGVIRCNFDYNIILRVYPE